jgi:O-antigen/teichoic acid export membrane protein
LALAIGSGATAAIGFLFWWVAARNFSAQAVGLASAAISMMGLLGLFGDFGLGTLLIGETRRKLQDMTGFISAAILAAGASSIFFSICYLAAAQIWPRTLGSFLPTRTDNLLFLAGCGVTGFTLVLDSAYVGLLQSSLQMWRGIAASAMKLLLLLAVGALTSGNGNESTIILSLLGGQVLSVLLITGLPGLGGRALFVAPKFRLLRPHVFDVVGHHLLNLAAQSPSLVIPFLVTALISPEANAAFYAAWMVLNVVLLGPASLTTLLFAFGAVEPMLIGQRLRFSLLLSAAISIAAWLGLTLCSGTVLGLFGPVYAERGAPVLRILGFAVFAVSVKYHFIAIQRLKNRMGTAALVLGAGAVAELGLAIVGAGFDGMLGFARGWVLAVYVEALVMIPALLRGAPAPTARYRAK